MVVVDVDRRSVDELDVIVILSFVTVTLLTLGEVEVVSVRLSAKEI